MHAVIFLAVVVHSYDDNVFVYNYNPRGPIKSDSSVYYSSEKDVDVDVDVDEYFDWDSA